MRLLLFHNLLDIADLFLNLAGNPFEVAFGFHLRITD